MLGHSDTWSLTKISDFYAQRKTLDIKKVKIHRIFRAREVKQSYLTSIGTTIVGFFHAIYIAARSMPDMIVTNGPGTAVPLCYAAFFISRMMHLKPNAKQIYIESFCRVKSLSLSGKLLKPIVDKFVVQWHPLKSKSKYFTYLNDTKLV